MLIKLKAKCIKCNFKKEAFRIFAWSPIGEYEGITLSPYMTFSSKGEDSYLTEGKEYEIEVKEISCDNRYGSCVKIISVLNLGNIDFDKISQEEKFQILMECTSSERIANNILEAYPNFISIVLKDGKEAIDIKKIKGVGEAYLNSYTRTLTEKFKYYAMLQKYKSWDINVTDCKSLISMFFNEENIDKILNENPYKVLIQCLKRSFENADRLIMELRPDLKCSEQRCSYLILSVLERNEEEGDTYIDANVLYNYIMSEYPIAKDLEEYIVPTVLNNELFYYDEETKRISIATTYNGECVIKDLVINKTESPNVLNIDWEKYTNVDGFQLTEEQSMLLKNFCEKDITILVGRAGSGKTSSIKALVKLMEDNNISYTLLTPTGASALRVAEQTNRTASTIHRKCLRDKEINSDAIIIDECGMVSLDVFIMLIDCITNPKCKIVLCGDPYQLPSIGKGCVFNDIINSKKVCIAELTKVFRYDTNGGAFVGENVRQGKKFLNSDKVKYHSETNSYTIFNNYKFIETEDIFQNVIEEYARLRKKYKEDEIIILSPYNVGECGSYKLNETIENEYNPPKPKQKSLSYKNDSVNITFRIGSRVINTKNDYKALPLESFEQIEQSNGILTEEDVELTQLYNGQIGVVRDIQDKYMVCQFSEELIVIQKQKLNTLLLARAISTHRSQGGEWKAVINIVSPMHQRLLSKQLLYVSDTRAKEFHCDIGQQKTFEDSLLVDVVAQRNTWLEELLENEKN